MIDSGLRLADLLQRRPDLPTPAPGKETWRVCWPGGKIERFATEHQARDRFWALLMGPTKNAGLKLFEKSRSGRWEIRSQISGGTRSGTVPASAAGRAATMTAVGRQAVLGGIVPRRPVPAPARPAAKRSLTIPLANQAPAWLMGPPERWKRPRGYRMTGAEREAFFRDLKRERHDDMIERAFGSRPTR